MTTPMELKDSLTGSDSGETQATGDTTTVVTESAAEPVVDYRAQYEALQQEHTKLTNDLKSLQGQRGSQAQLREEIKGIAERLDRYAEGQRVLLKMYKPDADPEAVEREYAAIETKHATTSATSRAERRYQSLLKQMGEYGADKPGNEAFDAWNIIVDDADISVGEKLIDLALIVGDAKARWERTKEQTKAQEREAKLAKTQADAIKAAEKKALERAGVLDMDTGGSGSAVVEESGAVLAKRYAAGEPLTDEQKKKAHAHLDNLSRAPGSLLRRK